jgi:hypothetical protein
MKQIPGVVVRELNGFLVNLGADIHFFPLSFSDLLTVFQGTQGPPRNQPATKNSRYRI